uniref:Polysaccharide biosynthesis domain containing 1 n=1 Tax=Catharus ustulatus TaxID=91951 RepID=A0A8C3U5G0_CATUS
MGFISLFWGFIPDYFGFISLIFGVFFTDFMGFISLFWGFIPDYFGFLSLIFGPPQLLQSVEPRGLSLTPLDERIYREFRKNFPELRVDVLDPEELKSEAAKEKWRPFCLSFQELLPDFNFGTLLRLDSSGEYSEENSILAPRIQFFAIEIARNREGCNDGVFRKSG